MSIGQREMKKKVDLSIIDEMSGHEFEHFCARLLKFNGFEEVRVTPATGDQGVDILASKDGVKYAIQCKNYSSPLNNTPIQEVSAGRLFYNCHVGVVFTNSTFTSGAIQLANATNVLLWDRNKLKDLILHAGEFDVLGIKNNTNNSMSKSAYTPKKHPSNEEDRLFKKEINLSFWIKVCNGFSILGILSAFMGIFYFFFEDHDTSLISGGLGFSAFLFVMKIMLKKIESSDKGERYVEVHKMQIRKPLFVIASITLAYLLLFGIMLAFGDLEVEVYY